jgi:hypothetical protein
MLPRNSLAGCAMALVGALALTGTASAAPALQFVAGDTYVRLSDDLLDALTALHVTPAPVLPGRLEVVNEGARLVFPIPTGELDAEGPKLEVLHSGGFTLSAGDVRVALTSFIIENLGDSLRITGILKVNDTIVGRAPLFDLELTQAPVLTSTAGDVTLVAIRGVRVTLTAEAADALNTAFGLSGAFTEGFPIGNARVKGNLRDYDGSLIN